MKTSNGLVKQLLLNNNTHFLITTINNWIKIKSIDFEVGLNGHNQIKIQLFGL
jgi:hypothetical protein